MDETEKIEEKEKMDVKTKVFIALSIAITILFLAIGATFCYRSYV